MQLLLFTFREFMQTVEFCSCNLTNKTRTEQTIGNIWPYLVGYSRILTIQY